MSCKNIIFYGLWFLLTILLAYWFSYPGIFDAKYSFGANDPTLLVWILNWQLTQLSLGNFDQLFTGNSFYPLDRSIYFQDSIFSTVLLVFPVFFITQDPYICYGVAIFSSHVLSSLGMFLLARQLKLDHAAALLAAIIFTFSESRYGISAYANLLVTQWMPFTLLFVHKYFDESKRVFLYWASLFYLMQITATVYHGIFFSVILLPFICILIYQQDNFRFKNFTLDIIPPTLIVVAVASIYFIPYLHEANEFGFKRSIVNQSVFGAPLATFFALPSSYFWGTWTSLLHHIDGSTAPRYLPILLTTAGLLVYRKKTPINFVFSSKLKIFVIGVIFLTPVTWLLKSPITTLGLKIYPDLILHPQLVSTVLLSPLFFVLAACFFMTKFFRKVYHGLCSEKIFLLYLSIAMLAFFVSLGPIIKLYGNQHIMVNPITTFLYYVFPGFSSIRAISRMAILIPLGLGITAGIAYMAIRARLDKPLFKKIFTFIIFTFFLLEVYSNKDLHAPYQQPRDKTPKEYLWLKQAPDGPVMEWPMSTNFLGDLVYVENSMLYQKRLVNGYAAFEWDGRKKLAELKDISSKRALLSLYAFGVRYLVVHRVSGKFPKWTGETLGEFNRVETFDNALVYLNKNAKTNFLPESFLDYCSISVEKANDKNRLILRFNSPEVHYVSKNKKQLKFKVNWKHNHPSSLYEWTFYPTLWRDGDSYEFILDKNLDRVPESVELIDSASGEKIFRKIMLR
jgi:hypothetical protein